MSVMARIASSSRMPSRVSQRFEGLGLAFPECVPCALFVALELSDQARWTLLPYATLIDVTFSV